MDEASLRLALARVVAAEKAVTLSSQSAIVPLRNVVDGVEELDHSGVKARKRARPEVDREGLRISSLLKFLPPRVSRSDGLDSLRSELRIGVRAPKLALVSLFFSFFGI